MIGWFGLMWVIFIIFHNQDKESFKNNKSKIPIPNWDFAFITTLLVLQKLPDTHHNPDV
jgi:hypothetical protein